MSLSIFPGIAVAAPKILLPADTARDDFALWPVIACDQFTSEPDYWSETERLTRDVPSTLHMILPEVYLESLSQSALDGKIAAINRSMRQYTCDGTLRSLPEGFILVDRTTSVHSSRAGLMLAVDLEQYDFTPGNKSLIRATEGTVLSRIPPRVRIRRDAPLEVPHIMLLIDDPLHTVIEPALASLKKTSEPLYNVDLMQGGGHVSGYFTEAASSVSGGILNALRGLLAASSDGLLFAVGDGNHSLATAKAHWEAIRASVAPDRRTVHPARFALVEVVNIHDSGLDFEPIHRVAFGLSSERFYATAGHYFAELGFRFALASDLDNDALTGTDAQTIPVLCGRERYVMTVNHPKHTLAVGTLQSYLDHIEKTQTGVRIDYIHGEEAVKNLSLEGNTGFLLPAIAKNSFFQTITADGVFPRKTFSMGESFEKRYYMESKRIIEEAQI